jgi:glycosyltransferase involved in cell wall biosynthesis
MQKKHIVIVTTNFANGGTERRASVLANEFAKNGYKVTYLVMNKIYPDVVYKLREDIELVCIGDFFENDVAIKEKQQAEIWKKKKSKYLRKLHRIVKLCNFDDIKIKSQKNSLERFSAIRAFALYNSNSIYICFGLGNYESIYYGASGLKNTLIYTDASAPDFKDEEKRYNYYKKVQSKALRKADCCVFQTAEQRDYYGYCVKKNSTIIKNPLTAKLPERFVGKRQNIIVNFCRTHPIKNLGLLVDAFARFSKKHPDYSLVIYGITCTEISFKYKNEIIHRINELGISDKVAFLDAVPDVHKKIVDYSMFVSTSDSEGLSNSMIEAMAMGLPCVCTDCLGGGAREMINDGENGLLVPVKDVKALCKAMCRMVSEEGLAEKCSQNASKIREELSVESIVNQWLNVIESL